MDEYIDVLDKNGNKTGVEKLKSEIHRDGDWHKTSHSWIINSRSELLIQKRSPKKENHPNFWDVSAAGHIFAGEDSLTAALREIKEELGLKINKAEIKYLFTVKGRAVLNDGTFIDNGFHDVFLVKKDIDISDVKLQKDEVTEIKFVDFRELEKLIKKDNSFVPHPKEYKKLFEFLEKNF